MENKTANKLVIAINGRSGVGKDTLIDAAARHFKIRNASSIDPIRNMGAISGWEVIKDDHWRKMIIKIKAALIEYNDFPTRYLVENYKDFLASNDEIMFVHIREPKEIKKFQKQVPCITLLITRQSADTFHHANDDGVTRMKYDYEFKNDKGIEQSSNDFISFLRTTLAQAQTQV